MEAVEGTQGRCQVTDDLIDEMAVELAMEGDTDVPLTAKEMKAAWRRLEAPNLDASEIADLLGITPRTVFRWRQGMTPVSRPGRSARLVATGAIATVTTPPIQPSPPAQTLEVRLAEGRKSQLKSVQQAAKRANEAPERFRQVEQEERGKAAARAGIARLERELREAKAKL